MLFDVVWLCVALSRRLVNACATVGNCVLFKAECVA